MGQAIAANHLAINVSASTALQYDVLISAGTDITLNQPNVIVHSLSIESGAALTGNGNFTVRTDLTNQGNLTNLGGTVQGNFNNSSIAVITGALAVQGTFTNYGTVDINSGASLNFSQDTTNNGEIDLYGGSLSAPDTFINDGLFNWNGGTLATFFQNTATMTITGGVDHNIPANSILVNSGTITQISAANVYMSGSNGNLAVISNQAGAVLHPSGRGRHH